MSPPASRNISLARPKSPATYKQFPNLLKKEVRSKEEDEKSKCGRDRIRFRNQFDGGESNATGA